MSHELPGESDTSRHKEEPEHQALKAVLSEEEQLLRDIEHVITQTQDKDEALAEIEQHYLPKLEDAGRRFELALQAWREKIERQLADLEKEAGQ